MPQLLTRPVTPAGAPALPSEAPNRPFGRDLLSDAVDAILAGIGIDNPLSPTASKASQLGGLLAAALPFGMAARSGKSALTLADAVSQIEAKTGAQLRVSVNPDVGGRAFINLDEIWVPPDQRGQGRGTQAMKMLTDWADANQHHIQLSADSTARGAKGSAAADARLKSFYKDAGFVENKGRNKDFSLGGISSKNTMYRSPAAAAEEVAPAEEYRGLHKAPGPEDNAPLHDLTKTYPEDVYGPHGEQYYGDRSGHDAETFKIVQAAKGKPDAEVTVYRAVPSDVPATIHPGDWVTINRDYAAQHGEGPLGGNYSIAAKRVKAKELFTNGDSIHEWGYHPADKGGDSPSDGGLPDILKKYGIALPFAGAAAAVTHGSQGR